MVLQSKFGLSDETIADSSVGWVVPVPSVPEIPSMHFFEAANSFNRIDHASRPRTIELRKMLPNLATIAFVVASISCLVLGLLSAGRKRAKKQRNLLMRFGFYGAAISLLIVVATPNYLAGRAGSGVEVVKSEKTGIYDASVIRADSSAALLEWLNANGF